ncbi:MAG: type II secretion system protein [Bdellovibrionales bacterium]
MDQKTEQKNLFLKMRCARFGISSTYIRSTHFNSNTEKSKKGFSLIELMMALGILGILMTGFATYITSATRAQKAISVKMDRQDFRNLISISPSTSLSMPSIPQKCADDIGSKLPAFNTWPVTPSFTMPNTTVLNQYNADGTIFAPLANLGTGVIFGTTTLRIASITVTGLDQAVTLPVALATAQKLVILRFSVQPTDATLASLSTFILPMNLTIDSTGTVVGCQISQNAAAAPAAPPAAPPANSGPSVRNGSNPTCPAGTTPGLKNWSSETCRSGGGNCTTATGWSLTPLSCDYTVFCNSAYCTNAKCPTTNWTQVLCL